MKRDVICAIAVVLVLVSAQHVRAQVVSTVTAQVVNVREAPDTTSRVIGTIKGGTEVEVLESVGGWHLIRAAGDVEGYVHESVLSSPQKKPAPSRAKPLPRVEPPTLPPERVTPTPRQPAAPPGVAPEPAETPGPPPATKTARARPGASLRGLAFVNHSSFTASKTFDAVLGTASGTMFGGGAQVVLPGGVFVQGELERFRKVGQRVFVFEDQVFPLGIKDTVTVTPVTISGGYRYGRFPRLMPYGGAGIGWHLFEETSDFAEADENIRSWTRGYHALAGVEFRVWRWIGAALETRYTWVPDAFDGGVAASFSETDLGGSSIRAKLIIGR